jgi:hypothetical protein
LNHPIYIDFNFPVYLPQNVLYNSVDQNKDDISADLKACCNTGVESLEKSKVLPSAGGDVTTECPDGRSGGLQDWEIALIVLGVLLALFFIILLIYFFIRSG